MAILQLAWLSKFHKHDFALQRTLKCLYDNVQIMQDGSSKIQVTKDVPLITNLLKKPVICSGKIRLRVKIFEFCPVNRFWLQCFDIYVFNDCPMCVHNCFFVILNGFKYSFVCRNVEKKIHNAYRKEKRAIIQSVLT